MKTSLIAAVLCAFIFTACGAVKNTPKENFQVSPPPKEANESSGSNKEPQEILLSSFSTKIYERRGGRENNLNLAAESINNTVVEPGQEFSFNETVGKRTKSKGYEKAIVFKNGEKVFDYGGGVCQVSSTLYNAAKNAGMEITERHDHKQETSYLPKGQDAAVAYGEMDLKFINRLDKSIIIRIEITETDVIAKIFQKNY